MKETTLLCHLSNPHPDPSKSIFVGCSAASRAQTGRLSQALCRNSSANSHMVHQLSWSCQICETPCSVGKQRQHGTSTRRQTCCDKKAERDLKTNPLWESSQKKSAVFVPRPRAYGSARLPFGHLFVKLWSIPFDGVHCTRWRQILPTPFHPRPTCACLAHWHSSLQRLLSRGGSVGGWGGVGGGGITMNQKVPVQIISLLTSIRTAVRIIRLISRQLYTLKQASFKRWDHCTFQEPGDINKHRI